MSVGSIHVKCSVGIQAANRDELIAFVDRVVAMTTAHPNPDVYLRIEQPCGESVSYRTRDDVPSESVPCLCGNDFADEHWFIKYEAA